jgi:hypothetical protein
VALGTPQANQARPVVLRGATVITGSGDPAITNAVIVIEGERIAAVGNSSSSVPAGAELVDLSGKYIIPGLVESHAHYEEWMGEVMLNYGVTTALAVGGDFGRLKENSRKPAYRAPRIYDTAGRPRLADDMTEEEVRRNVREWLQKKPDFTKMPDYNASSSRAFAWAADEIHKAGIMVFGHTENAPESIRAGHDVVEHIWGFIIPTMTPKEHEDFQAGRYLHWSTFLRDWDQLEQEMRNAIAQGAYLNPTFGYELGSLSPLAERHELEIYELYRDPFLMAYYPQNIAQSLLQKQRQIRNFSGKYENLVLLSRLSSAEREEYQRGYRLAGRFVSRYVQLGGKLQAGTDTISGGTPGHSLHQEMDLFVEAGLKPMQALQSATLWSAEMLAGKNGALGRPLVGVLSPGAYADLVVLSANPLEDISNTRKIERVMKGGQFIELGYDPAYHSFARPPRSIAMATPRPEISAITPHAVVEGAPEFELVVEGVGFVGNSVIRVNNVALPTTFLNPRLIRAKVPASYARSATPNPFDAPGPEQHSGVFGDPTLSITVYNPPPEGGTSNSISLAIRPTWMGLKPGMQ